MHFSERFNLEDPNQRAVDELRYTLNRDHGRNAIADVPRRPKFIAGLPGHNAKTRTSPTFSELNAFAGCVN